MANGLVELRHAAAGGDEGRLLDALSRPAEPWRLVALRGLLACGHVLAPAAAERFLEHGVVDPFLEGVCLLAVAQHGGAPAERLVDDLAERALGRRGAPWEGPWPPRPALARRTGEGWPIRRLAVEALAAVAPAHAVIEAALARDPDWAVRAAAARSLSGSGANEQALGAARDDRHGAVRAAAGNDDGAPDAVDAWRVPDFEPYFRYVAASARREYADELGPGAREGNGRNWASFGLFLDLDLGEPGPDDVSETHPYLTEHLRGVPAARTLARDLVHHPAIGWGEDPHWPICCGDFTLFYGHQLAEVAPSTQDLEVWFQESLDSDLPLPVERLPDLDAEVYAFRCGRCGDWVTRYAPGF